MTKITFKGNPVNTNGNLPAKGSTAPDFKLTKTDLSEVSLSDLKGRRLILNIFPSVDTSTCATSVRKFNERAADLENTTVLCISKDLPFAHKRFCAVEGLDNVIPLSDFRHADFARRYGVQIEDGPLAGLDARAVVVIDEKGTVQHSQLVEEIADEPDYDEALKELVV